MAKKLTPITVENAKPRAGRYEIPDAACRGLHLVVQPSGAKSWAVRYRHEGKPAKLTLQPGPGEPPLTLAAARKLAAAAMYQVEQGLDPAAEKKSRIEAGHNTAAARAGDTVEHLAAAFIEKYAKPKNRAWGQVEKTFAREVLPKWQGRSVHDIGREDVENLIDRIADSGRPIMARRLLSMLRRFFSWMTGKGRSSLRRRLAGNPCISIEAPGQEHRRDRVLTNDEIVSLWAACEAEGEPYGHLIKIMLLTGQRRGEVAGMRYAELDLNRCLWAMPGERTKNGIAHVVPLSDQVMAIIQDVTEIAGGFVFTSTGTKGIAGFARLKARLEQRMGSVPGSWTLHDLRRTAATGMADAGILPHVIEAALNHVSGHKRGVAGVYNRATYLAEKTAALQAWADHVVELVTGKPAKVVPMRGRR